MTDGEERTVKAAISSLAGASLLTFLTSEYGHDVEAKLISIWIFLWIVIGWLISPNKN